jgi:ribosomal protein L29
LFTALHHRLEPTVQGLAALRRYSLDELLRALYDACNSPQELEARLQQAVQQLQEPEQDSQAANAVLQMLQPLYVYVSQETMAGGGLAAETLAADLDWLNGENAVGTGGTESSRITWLESESPNEGEATAEPPAFSAPAVLASELPEPCRQLLHRSAGSLMATIENTLSELGNALDEGLQDEDPDQYLSLKHQVLRGLLKDVEGSAALFRGILSRLEQSEWGLLRPAGNAGQPGEMAEMPLQVGDPYAALRQVLATSELARQKPQLEQEVMRLVRRSIGAIKTAIENALSELGQALDEQFQSRPLEEALVLKYQTLRAFLQEVEEISTKFAAFLARMEEAERRLFGLV